MKITTLGTSHGDPTYNRFNSSTLYDINGKFYLVDAGEPVTALLIRRGIRPGRLKAVFVTHMHGDHAAGLAALVKHLVKYHKPEEHTVFFLPEDGAEAALRVWLKALHVEVNEEAVSFRVTRVGALYDDGVLRAAARRTQHMCWRESADVPSYAYELYAEGKRVLHTGDLRGDFADFPAGDEPWDLCLTESTHYQPESARPFLEAAHLRRLILIHLANRWHGDGEALLRETWADLPYPVAIAHDGDEFCE